MSALPARAELLARVLVQASAVAAVLLGCFLLPARDAVATGGTFILVAALARRRFDLATAIVLLFAYTSVGVALAVGQALDGASLWLAAMSGLVAGGLSWLRWSAPLAWRWPLILWLLGVALSWPLIAAREADFSLLSPRTDVGAAIVGALIYLTAGLWLDALLSWKAETIERRVARPLLASAVISACAVFYQGFVDISWLSGPPWIGLHRAPGLMGDANPMAVALGIWAPLALAISASHRRVGVWIGILVSALLWSGAWLTGARTVLLLLFAGIIGVLRGALSGVRRTRLAIAVLCATIVVTAIVAFAPFEIFVRGPVARLITEFPVRQPRGVLYEALWSRGGYGLAAVESIKQHPWTGVGVGTYNRIQVEYHPQTLYAPVPPDNAQNFWRHALAERGVFGFVAVVALTVCTFSILLRRAQAPPLFSSTLKAAIFGLGLALIFGVPTQNPAIAVTAASIIGWLHGFGAQPQKITGGRRYAAALTIAWALAVGGVAVDGWKAVTDLRPAVRAARAGDFYAYGFGDAQIGPDGSRGRAVLGRAVAALTVDSTDYELKYWSQSAREERLRVWQDGRLVLNEAVRGGRVGERILKVAPGARGVLIEFASDSSDIFVSGRFR